MKSLVRLIIITILVFAAVNVFADNGRHAKSKAKFHIVNSRKKRERKARVGTILTAVGGVGSAVGIFTLNPIILVPSLIIEGVGARQMARNHHQINVNSKRRHHRR
ncbi:hypothetical protein KMW28_27185 [Flammeovirga yaeyamensis]|uniref:Transmembrane protein n=1 Tax=Flammeovirga yaeyamensis TaxID=367791 RepID=A0AAX1NAV4_9BACT|nr:hypothetical protein [Flammeovirga yaeyamensis]MBB3700035.1 hypothetical protein [Flammeovirga yaeyamensis]NMF37528.1 hypothetical protein [Flammeovirga yaeyamensis]QWG04585.1 hypothetical protein KMW28_27185 [Flammeovirga yaeyamensis]